MSRSETRSTKTKRSKENSDPRKGAGGGPRLEGIAPAAIAAADLSPPTRAAPRRRDRETGGKNGGKKWKRGPLKQKTKRERERRSRFFFQRNSRPLLPLSHRNQTSPCSLRRNHERIRRRARAQAHPQPGGRRGLWGELEIGNGGGDEKQASRRQREIARLLCSSSALAFAREIRASRERR